MERNSYADEGKNAPGNKEVIDLIYYT